MPFNPKTAKAAGQKSRRGPSKLLDPNIKEKMEILYEGVLDHLIMHQEDLSMSDRVKLLQSLSNYILPKLNLFEMNLPFRSLQKERVFLLWKEDHILQSSSNLHKSICVIVLINLRAYIT